MVIAKSAKSELGFSILERCGQLDYDGRCYKGKIRIMELREFVGNALRQIVAGVKDAQNDVMINGGIVNPRAVELRGRSDQQGGLVAENGEPIRDVQFDLVVTVGDDTNAEGESTPSCPGLLEVGPHSEMVTSTSAVNRIRFKVPVSLPIPTPQANPKVQKT